MSTVCKMGKGLLSLPSVVGCDTIKASTHINFEQGGNTVQGVNGWVMRWILNILAIVLTAALIPGFQVSFWGAVVGSVLLGVVNAIIKPIIILLTLPINIVTLGLFTLVINGFMLWMVAVTVKGFDVTGFGWAILTALMLSIISTVLSWFVRD